MGKRKARKEKIEENYGNKLTFLSNDQAKILLDKYEKTIYFQCRKRSFIPGVDLKDLEQECRIKILGGYHSFERSRKVKEKTWVVNVINHTLDGLWNHHLKNKRVCYVDSEEGEKPVYNFSIDDKASGDFEKLSLEDTYQSSPDGRPVFGSISESPEESLFFIHALEFLKINLSKEFYDFIKSKVFPDNSYNEILRLEEKFRRELIEEGFSHIKEKHEFTVFQKLNRVEMNELEILNETATLMINHFGFRREDIYKREKMLFINDKEDLGLKGLNQSG